MRVQSWLVGFKEIDDMLDLLRVIVRVMRRVKDQIYLLIAIRNLEEMGEGGMQMPKPQVMLSVRHLRLELLLSFRQVDEPDDMDMWVL